MRRALVTGSSGFIGTRMTALLRENGYHVSSVDINSPGPADARDFFRTGRVVYDVCVHCAAVVGGRTTIDYSPLDHAVNLELDAALFAWALRTRPGRVVYLSSSAAYPVSRQGGGLGSRSLQEDDITLGRQHRAIGTPDALYGWAKLTGEKLAIMAREEGLPVTVVRPFSGYGAEQTTDYPFRSFLDRTLAHADPFEIWGTGEQVRDWIHVSDICGAILAMIEQGIDGPANLGTGSGTSMHQLAEMFTRAAGYSPEFRVHPEKPSGVQYRVADSRLMRTFYRPATTLEQEIQRAVHPDS